MNRQRAVQFFPAAQEELRAAVDYFNDQCAGLGFEFAVEIRRTISRILYSPAAWTKISPRTRRCLTHRFPYAIIFQYTDSHLFIVAVMHLKREPVAWQNNLPGNSL